MTRSLSKTAALIHLGPPSNLRRTARRGISLAEMMIVIAMIAILSVLVLAMVSNLRRNANGAVCLKNLHTIQVAFLQYANDNGDHYPPATRPPGRNWESLLSPYIGPIGAFYCPADSEIFPHDGSSYDWRDVPDSDATLAGKHAGGAIRGHAVLAFETLPGWHSRNKMNAVLIDGSSGPMDADACLLDLTKPIAIARPRGP
jgi:prepilin-type N-terminal cleavage/methylation domain-containing protein